MGGNEVTHCPAHLLCAHFESCQTGNLSANRWQRTERLCHVCFRQTPKCQQHDWINNRVPCIMCPAHNPTKYKACQRKSCVLESVISRSKEDTLEETTQSKDWEKCESEDRRHAATITGRSPFTAYFQQAMQEVKEQEAGEDTCLVKEDNPYFCPGIITLLFDTYLAIFPLWNGLLLGDLSRYESHEEDLVTTKKQPKTRDTNCHVEKWFGIVKHSIMEKGKQNKPGTFIRKMHQSLKGRYTENIIQHNLPLKLLLQPEPPETPVNLDQSLETWMKKNLPQKPLLQPETPVNLDQSQETWMKKNQERFPSTKSKIYSVPQKIPVPKKRRLDVTEQETFKLSHKSASCKGTPCRWRGNEVISTKPKNMYCVYEGTLLFTVWTSCHYRSTRYGRRHLQSRL